MEKYIKPWLLEPAKSYAFTNANIINVLDGSIHANSTLMVSNGHITSISSHPPSTTGDDKDSTQTVDLKGKYIIPGLIDSHVHFVATPGESDPRAMLEADPDLALLRMTNVASGMLRRGFTTVRDCGGAPVALRSAIADNVIPGPRVQLAGHALTQTGGHVDFRNGHTHALPECPACGSVRSMARLCDGAESCLRIARDELRRGADFLKLIGSGGLLTARTSLDHPQFTAAEVQAICSVAENAGTYVTAHAYTTRAIRLAIDNGVKGIEHGNFLDAPTAKLMAERNVFLTPTLAAFAVVLDGPGPPRPPPVKEKHQRTLDAGLEAMRLAKEAGVTMCLGTDLLGPSHAFQGREFKLRTSVCSALEILQQATVNPARMMKLGDMLGQAKEGFLADFLVLKSNPLEDISILEQEGNILAVFKEGRAYCSQLEGVPGLLT